MNDCALHQWDTYRREANMSCPDCAWLLLAMVDEHDPAEGVARPGVERLALLCRRNRRWVINHLSECVADGHLVLVNQWPKATRKADEYAIPWLDNPR